MIQVHAVRIRLRGVLLVLLGLTALSVPARAEPGHPQDGQALGADSVGQRVRERSRMQLEYEEMREERRLALAAARKSVAPGLSGGGEQAPNPGGIRGIAGGSGGGRDPRDRTAEGTPLGAERGEGARIFILLAASGLLCTTLVLRFRRR